MLKVFFGISICLNIILLIGYYFVYKYSVNPIGLETVKMYTDESVVTLFSGVSFLIAKLFVGGSICHTDDEILWETL